MASDLTKLQLKGICMTWHVASLECCLVLCADAVLHAMLSMLSVGVSYAWLLAQLCMLCKTSDRCWPEAGRSAQGFTHASHTATMTRAA